MDSKSGHEDGPGFKYNLLNNKFFEGIFIAGSLVSGRMIVLGSSEARGCSFEGTFCNDGFYQDGKYLWNQALGGDHYQGGFKSN